MSEKLTNAQLQEIIEDQKKQIIHLEKENSRLEKLTFYEEVIDEGGHFGPKEKSVKIQYRDKFFESRGRLFEAQITIEHLNRIIELLINPKLLDEESNIKKIIEANQHNHNFINPLN